MEFDRDTLLLYDAPFGVEFDMLISGFKRLQWYKTRLMLAIPLRNDVQPCSEALAVSTRPSAS